MEWISIEDELPETGQPILGYSEGYFNYPYDNKVLVVAFLGKYEFYNTEEDGTASKWPLFEIVENQGRASNITHWAPLPETP